MRHGKKFNHLSRKSAHRKAMLANMASSLIMHKRIRTTVAKAKALRGYVEPLITKSKDDTTHSRRTVFSYLQSKEAVTELFREVASKVADRPGGYTRILKTGNRLGDNAEMCFIELVDYNENLLTEKTTKAKSSRRRGGKKSATKVETPIVEETTEATKDVVEASEEVTELEAEATKEAVKEKVKEEVAEKVVEETKAKVKEEVKAEEKVEETSAEDKKEEPKEEKKEDTPEEEKK